jgi:hypothetical protein
MHTLMSSNGSRVFHGTMESELDMMRHLLNVIALCNELFAVAMHLKAAFAKNKTEYKKNPGH